MMFDYWHLTENRFAQFKRDYVFYGTRHIIDEYGSEGTVVDDEPRATIRTMWHPIEDRVTIADYGRDFDKVLYAIVYDMPAGLTYGDRVNIYGDEYEITAIKPYNTHKRVEVKKIT